MKMFILSMIFLVIVNLIDEPKAVILSWLMFTLVILNCILFVI